MINRLHGEVHRHKLNHGPEPPKGSADAKAGKAMFGDRRIDHPLWPEFRQQPLGDLVGALVLGDLFAHHEHGRVAAHLLGHGIAQRLAHRHPLGVGEEAVLLTWRRLSQRTRRRRRPGLGSGFNGRSGRRASRR